MRRAVQSQPWGRWRRLLLRLFVSSFLRSTQELMEVTRMPQLRDARRLQTRREKLEKEALRLAVQEQLLIKEAASSSTPAQGVLTTARDEDRLRPRACVMGSGKYMGPVATLVAAALGLQFPAVHAGAHGSHQDATAQRCPPLTDTAREAGERGPSFGRPRAAVDQRSCIFVNSSPGSFDYSSRRGQAATKGMCDGLGQVHGAGGDACCCGSWFPVSCSPRRSSWKSPGCHSSEMPAAYRHGARSWRKRPFVWPSKSSW